MSGQPENKPAGGPDKSDQSGKTEPVKSVSHAWRSPAAVLIFLFVAAISLAADLWTKDIVFNSLMADPLFSRNLELLKADKRFADRESSDFLRAASPARQIMPCVRVTLSTNPGVVFGIRWLPRTGVLVATILTMGLVGFFFASSERRAWLMHISLGFILAGALGNMYDRLFSIVSLPGLTPIRYQVRDFIDCSQLGWGYIFNVADAWLVVGVAGLMIHWLIDARKNQARKKKQTQN